MVFFKKAWPFIITGLVVISIFALTYLHSNKPVAQIKIYKATPAQVQTEGSQAKSTTHQRAQGVETSESPIVSERHLTTDDSLGPTDDSLATEEGKNLDEALRLALGPTDDSLATEEVVMGLDEGEDVDSHPRDTEEPSANPQLSAEELRRQELLQRKAEIDEQMQAIIPEGVTVHSSENPEVIRQFFQLHQELVAVEQELSNNPQDPRFEDARHLNKRVMFLLEDVTPNLTPDGKLPISTAEKLIQTWEQDGNFAAANRMRQVIQHAVENGDALIERKHVEGLR